VFRGRAVGTIASLIDRAQRFDTAEAEIDTGTEMFQADARRLTSAPLTLLIFQNRTIEKQVQVDLADVRDRSGFLTSVSDELRTPLTVVLSYAKLLAEPDVELDDSVRTTMVQDMTDQAWDLAGVVEDLLAVARTEMGELNVVTVPVNLVANVAQVIESMGSRGGPISVIGDRTVTALGDPARFRQIVRNLLSNALSHGSEPITVEVSRTDTGAKLRVKDRGSGLSDELAVSVFDHAVTGDITLTPGRIGIGLWISRELTGLMGGRLAYHRERGESIFEVTLPVEARA
jgi:two-component system sensor histidine kinase MtrB